MKFVLFVEGKTEKEVLADFVSRGINPRLDIPVRISIVGFKGFGEYLSSIRDRVELYLSGREQREIIAAIGLIDLYGPSFFPQHMSINEKTAWGKAELEKRVGHSKFRQHFAVHETEAWLLGHAEILPRAVRDVLPQRCSRPETVNMNEPPSRLLDRLYRDRLNRGYRKTIDGRNLFLSCSPEVVAAKCPHLARMLDELAQLAHEAGHS